MMVPRRPTGTEKLSLTFTTRSNRWNSASRSGMTPCCCSKGWKEESMCSKEEKASSHWKLLVCGGMVSWAQAESKHPLQPQPSPRRASSLLTVSWVLVLQACHHAGLRQCLFPIYLQSNSSSFGLLYRHLLCTAGGASLLLVLSYYSFFAEEEKIQIENYKIIHQLHHLWILQSQIKVLILRIPKVLHL